MLFFRQSPRLPGIRNIFYKAEFKFPSLPYIAVFFRKSKPQTSVNQPGAIISPVCCFSGILFFRYVIYRYVIYPALYFPGTLFSRHFIFPTLYLPGTLFSRHVTFTAYFSRHIIFPAYYFPRYIIPPIRYSSGISEIISFIGIHILSHSSALWFSSIVFAAFCIAGKPVLVSWFA